jgi:hypothetical protein
MGRSILKERDCTNGNSESQVGYDTYGPQWEGGAQTLDESFIAAIANLIRTGDERASLFGLVAKCFDLDWKDLNRPDALKVLPHLLASWNQHEGCANEEAYRYWDLLQDLLIEVNEALEMCNPEGFWYSKMVLEDARIVTDVLIHAAGERRQAVVPQKSEQQIMPETAPEVPNRS